MKRNIGLLAIAVMLMLHTLSGTQALMVSGVVFSPEVNAGDHVRHEIVITLKDSENATDLTANISYWNQTIDGSNNPIEEGDINGQYSAKDFLTITPNSIHLEPGSIEKFIIEGDIPSDATSGGKYAIVTLKQPPKEYIAGNGKTGRINTVIAYQILIMIKVMGEITQTGEITDLSIEEPTSSSQQNVAMILKNTGNFHYKPDINIAIKDKDGKIVANTTLIRDSSIFPQFSNRFSFSLTPDHELEPGRYDVEARVYLKDGTQIASKEKEITIK